MNIIKINRTRQWSIDVPNKSPAELATERYLEMHLKKFRGPAGERKRLNHLAQSRIDGVAWNAPKFYASKLANIIDQASSLLARHNTNTSAGAKRFHKTHSEFLRVLSELSKSQPAGEISYHHEISRIKQLRALRQERADLSTKISQLGSQEIDLDDLGGDLYSPSASTDYHVVFDELEQLKSKLSEVSLQLAIFTGKQVDFKFSTLKPGSFLSILSSHRLRQLELLIGQFMVAGEAALNSAMVRQLVNKWITTLDLHARPDDDQLEHMIQDVRQAIKKFFMLQADESLQQHFDEIAKDQHLLPKEGIILKSPDDLPEEVQMELAASRRKYNRDLNQFLDRHLCNNMQPEEKDSEFSEIEQSFEEEPEEERKQIEVARNNLIAQVVKYRRRVEASPDNLHIYCDSELDKNRSGDLKVVDHQSLMQAEYDQMLTDLNDLLDGELVQYQGVDNSDVECLGIVEPDDKWCN